MMNQNTVGGSAPTMLGAGPAPQPDGGMECPPGCQEVPLEALAQPDDKEQMQTPGVGDSGTMQVDYTIEGVNGETAYVRPTAVNGNPIAGEDDGDEDESGGEASTDGLDNEGDDLRNQASQMSQGM